MSDIYCPESFPSPVEDAEYTSSPEGIERAMREGKILKSSVLFCDSSMRLHIDLGCMRGIIERDEAVFCRGGETIKDIAVISRVGKRVAFKVIGFCVERGEKVALLSRRAAQKECNEKYISALRVGDVIPATVTHLESFGAFLDIGCGLSSLLTVDSISVSRISHPRDRFTVGERIYVVVKSRDGESGRIYVSMRELLGTWEENAADFEVGQTVSGIIRSVESYGIFVELTPNLAGLAELKEEMGDASGLIGKKSAVYIKSILPDRMKIKLVLIDSCQSPDSMRTPSPIRYFCDVEQIKHISHWRYSPPSSRKLIESIFE